MVSVLLLILHLLKVITLLNYCQIGTAILDYAVGKVPLKIGLCTPGMHIPVVDEDEAMKAPADYFLLLA